jgi:hypothetical protein
MGMLSTKCDIRFVDWLRKRWVVVESCKRRLMRVHSLQDCSCHKCILRILDVLDLDYYRYLKISDLWLFDHLGMT